MIYFEFVDRGNQNLSIFKKILTFSVRTRAYEKRVTGLSPFRRPTPECLLESAV